MLPGNGVRLFRLGPGYVEGVDPRRAPSRPVNVHHDAGRIVGAFMENSHQDINHKLHSRIVVVEHDHPEILRLSQFPFLFYGRIRLIP